MNPRQRRGVLLIALAAVGAVAVFLSVSNYVADVRSQVGPMIEAVRLTSDAAAYTPLSPDQVELIEVPERWSPEVAVRDPLALAGLVPTTPLPAGTVLQEGMLVSPPQVGEGQREYAVAVNAETGVAGKIGSGSVVDVYAAFAGDQTTSAQAVIVVERALIVEVGTPRIEAQQDASGQFSEGEVVPVTFALSPDETLRLHYVATFAESVSLALRAPMDEERLPDGRRRYQPAAPPGSGAAAPAPAP